MDSVHGVANVEGVINELMARACQISDILERERQLAKDEASNPMNRHAGLCSGKSTTGVSRLETTIFEVAQNRQTSRHHQSNPQGTRKRSMDISCGSSMMVVNSVVSTKLENGADPLLALNLFLQSDHIPTLNSSITESLSRDSIAESKVNPPSMHSHQTSGRRLSVQRKDKDNEFYFPPPKPEVPKEPIVKPQFDGYKDYPVVVKNESGMYTGVAKVRISRFSTSQWLNIHYVILNESGEVMVDLKTELRGEKIRNTVVNGMPMADPL